MRNMTKRATAIVAGAASGVALAAVLAVPVAAHAGARSCGNECIATNGNDGVQPGYFWSEWVTNEGIWYTRGVAKCGNGTRNTILQLGGWVTSIDLKSQATCTNSYPNLVGAAYDVKKTAGGTITRTWKTLP